MKTYERFNQLILLHSLAWFVTGNILGLILSLLLVFPQLNSIISPLTYGRIIPTHFNIELYGWCSIPFLGLLAKWLYRPDSFPKTMESSIHFWSGTLIFGTLSWLSGESSGKLFLEWKGSLKFLWLLNLLYCWGCICFPYIKIFYKQSGNKINLKVAVVLSMLLIPIMFFLALKTTVYPPINPLSGGPTGTDLLGSNLAIILILLSIPKMLGNEIKQNTDILWIISLYLIHCLYFIFLEHGHVPHTQLSQQVSLWSLCIWIPVFTFYYKSFIWRINSIPWLLSLLFWSSILVIQASFCFMPPMLLKFKFTHIWVGHSHIAMAGMCTSLIFVILSQISPNNAFKCSLNVNLLWNFGLFGYLCMLLRTGWLESKQVHILFHTNDEITFLYSLRLIFGLIMTLSSLKIFIQNTTIPHQIETTIVPQKLHSTSFKSYLDKDY